MSASAALVTARLAFALLTAHLPVIVRCPRLGTPLTSFAFSKIGKVMGAALPAL
jgi:hypothetical protein